MASRVTKRPGFGDLRGALNVPITISDTAPLNPEVKDLWLNTFIYRLCYWSGVQWVCTISDASRLRTAPVSITLTNGTSTSTLADITTPGDGNFYTIKEDTGSPGTNFIVDFEDIEILSYICVLAGYDGSDTHAVALQVYNWVETRWDTYHSAQNGVVDVTTPGGYIYSDYRLDPDAAGDYIGTGVNLGNVRVRFYHTMSGTASHRLYIDSVLLYR